MSSTAPVIRKIAWVSLIPHMLVLGLLTLLFYQFFPEYYILASAGVYLFTSQLLRRTLAADHRKGMIKFRTGNFETAISYFKKSYSFFKKHEWIDKFRYLTLLSSSRLSYREMALNNIAFCYGQLGDGVRSKEYYLKTLDEFPNSGIAQAGLNLLKAAENVKDNESATGETF